MSETLLRTIWALGVISAGVGLYWLYNQRLLARSHGQLVGLGVTTPGIPTILHFTTPGCVLCKTIQRPALRALSEHLGDSVQVVEVDAAERPEAADHWGVLSVPTTFIIDAKEKTRFVNHGATRFEKLLQQVKRVG